MKKITYIVLPMILLWVFLTGCHQPNRLPERNKAVVRRAHEEVWSKGNMEAIKELYSPDYIAHWVSGPDSDRDGLRKMITETRTAFPDFKEEIIHIIAEGEMVVSHFIVSGTFKGELNGLQPTGKRGSRPEIAVHRLKDGKIVEQWTVADLLTLLNQLGVKL